MRYSCEQVALQYLAPITMAVICLHDILNEDNYLRNVKRSLNLCIQSDLWIGCGQNGIQRVRTFVSGHASEALQFTGILSD